MVHARTNFDFPVWANAKYNAIVHHNYPVLDHVSDGHTLYREKVSLNLFAFVATQPYQPVALRL